VPHVVNRAGGVIINISFNTSVVGIRIVQRVSPPMAASPH
jgi:hypothetical protein